MELKIKEELIGIADSLKFLKDNNIIRTMNLVGDLGEYYCKELLNLKINENVVEKGYDAKDVEENKVEIKTRRNPKGNAAVIFRGLDFNYFLFVELTEFYEALKIYKVNIEELKEHIRNTKSGYRISVNGIKNSCNHEVVYKND